MVVIALLLPRNKRWEGVNEVSARDSKHSSTKTGNMASDVLLTGELLRLSFSVLAKHVVSIELYKDSRGCVDGKSCDVVMTCSNSVVSLLLEGQNVGASAY